MQRTYCPARIPPDPVKWGEAQQRKLGLIARKIEEASAARMTIAWPPTGLLTGEPEK